MLLGVSAPFLPTNDSYHGQSVRQRQRLDRYHTFTTWDWDLCSALCEQPAWWGYLYYCLTFISLTSSSVLLGHSLHTQLRFGLAGLVWSLVNSFLAFPCSFIHWGQLGLRLGRVMQGGGDSDGEWETCLHQTTSLARLDRHTTTETDAGLPTRQSPPPDSSHNR